MIFAIRSSTEPSTPTVTISWVAKAKLVQLNHSWSLQRTAALRPTLIERGGRTSGMGQSALLLWSVVGISWVDPSSCSVLKKIEMIGIKKYLVNIIFKKIK